MSAKHTVWSLIKVNQVVYRYTSSKVVPVCLLFLHLLLKVTHLWIGIFIRSNFAHAWGNLHTQVNKASNGRKFKKKPAQNNRGLHFSIEADNKTKSQLKLWLSEAFCYSYSLLFTLQGRWERGENISSLAPWMVRLACVMTLVKCDNCILFAGMIQSVCLDYPVYFHI